jgi:hypothetical protein
MIVTAFRAGPTLASTGLLPQCRVLRTQECALCGLPYILVVTDGKERPEEICSCPPAHFDLLRQAITNSHATGHPNTRLRTDGVSVQEG